jgi:hypothetical protein
MRSKRRSPLEDDLPPEFFFVVPDPGTISPQIQRARAALLWEWVNGRYRPAHLHRFPPKGTVMDRGVPPPFPECAPEHPELVMRFQVAKLRSDELEDGTAEGYTPEDWHHYNEHLLLPLIVRIGRLCRNGHVDLTLVPRAPEMSIVPPPLPGAAPPRPQAGPAPAAGWRGYLTPADGELEG